MQSFSGIGIRGRPKRPAGDKEHRQNGQDGEAGPKKLILEGCWSMKRFLKRFGEFSLKPTVFRNSGRAEPPENPPATHATHAPNG